MVGSISKGVRNTSLSSVNPLTSIEELDTNQAQLVS